MKRYLCFIIPCVVAVILHASFTGDAPTTKAELGKLLFFDPILSKDRTISCATCHKPEFAFADTGVVSLGVGGSKGSRNTPSAMNLSLQRVFFWDGRATTLEQQALAPIANPIEMNLPVAEAVLRLKQSDAYKKYFDNIFNSEPSALHLAAALAAFERTLETIESPFDQWKFSNDSTAVDDAVKRGFAIFNGKAKCVRCHFGADFTANEFRNIGLFNGRDLNDSGRIVISGRPEDLGKFKVPSLRNIAITSPYMHNGKFRNLRQVVDFYNEPNKMVPNSINRDSILAKPLGLSERDRTDLVAFLLSLTDGSFSSLDQEY